MPLIAMATLGTVTSFPIPIEFIFDLLIYIELDVYHVIPMKLLLKLFFDFQYI